MAYATIGDVQARNRARPITATSVPNASDVGAFLDMSAGDIDALLTQQNYQLPVPTGAIAALSYLRSVNSLGAWAMTEQSAQSSIHARDATAAYERALRMLADAQVVLDIPRVDAVAMPRGPGVSSPHVGQVQRGFFCRDMER